MTEGIGSNMCGFRAPAINSPKVGIIGLGNRGMRALKRLLQLEQVQIKALCDIRKVCLEEAQSYLEQPVALYSGNTDAWKMLCEQELDLVYITTPWDLHTDQAVYAMLAGKHVAIEVPAAMTIEDCWRLVETSEKTRKHCVQLENCCYDLHEIVVLEMAQKGYFGEIIHGEGAYIHDLRNHFLSDRFYNQWQLKEHADKNGSLYATHGLGPISQVMGINRGDQFDYLVSVSSADFSLKNTISAAAKSNLELQQFANSSFNGNINTTIIKTVKQKTIQLQYDVSSVRPYTRGQLVSGTLGAALKYPLPARITIGEQWSDEGTYQELLETYTPEIVRVYRQIAKGLVHYGGMDMLMDWRLIDCLRKGLSMDQDVYDAAAWSAIGILSCRSVEKGSMPITIPDFTKGLWKENKPIDLSYPQEYTPTKLI